MGRAALAAAALLIGMSMSCEAGGYDSGYAGYRHHARAHHLHIYRRWPAKPYHVGVGGLIIVDEPYGAWIHERAVRTHRLYWVR
jgi:hypothetical protein